jgi:hypothetical protein
MMRGTQRFIEATRDYLCVSECVSRSYSPRSCRVPSSFVSRLKMLILIDQVCTAR